ncbi:MAG: adenylate cyclase [Cryptosporangiaceae bacterium]|nr:adenylate cyclase [Cryptosporangiaceae bacterium]
MGAARAPSGAPVRAVVWAAHVALPALGIGLLVAQPRLDALWRQPVAHFWLVGPVAAISAGLAVLTGRSARRHADGRLFLVSLAMLASAVFLGLHALATPDVLVPPNAGFVLATSFGLAVAGALALASAGEFTADRSAAVLRRAGILRAGVAILAVAWAVASVIRATPLGHPLGTGAYLTGLAAIGAGGFGIAAVRYALAYRSRPGVVLLSVLTAFVLLAEAAVAIAAGPSWHLSWWGWHLLILAGFCFVAYSAYAEYQREGSAAGIFDGVAAGPALAALRAEYADALESLVAALAASDPGSMGRVTARLAARFGLTSGQAAVLERAAEALAAERDQLRRLEAVAAIGRESSVVIAEDALVEAASVHLAAGFAPDEIRIRIGENDPGGYPLTVKGSPAGVLSARRPGGEFTARDAALLRSAAAQLSTGIENARLYQQIDVLFRQYLSPDVVSALLADPAQSDLGGAVAEVTALFADLRGFTSFSEDAAPAAIVALLNRYFEIATRCVLAEGGTIVQFVGDALLALFNAPARQPEHARRAACAALAIQAGIEPLAAGNPGWPRFRIGINTGPALVGNIGSEALRNFNAMGDAVNVASRLESAAEPGTVVLGGLSRDALGDRADVLPLGDLVVKGRRQPVRAYVLRGLS